MAAENVQTFTDGNFDQSVLQSGQPVLVDFWAEWCGPCKRLGPTIDQLASEYAGKVVVGKLNVDDNLAGIFAGELLYGRAEALARTAPLRPEIH